MNVLCRWLGHEWEASGWHVGRVGNVSLSRTCARCGIVEATPEVEPTYDGDYLFVRLTPDKLARAMIGDVNVVPTPDQIASAKSILGHTGTLYWTAASFRVSEWQPRPEEKASTVGKG